MSPALKPGPGLGLGQSTLSASVNALGRVPTYFLEASLPGVRVLQPLPGAVRPADSQQWGAGLGTRLILAGEWHEVWHLRKSHPELRPCGFQKSAGTRVSWGIVVGVLLQHRCVSCRGHGPRRCHHIMCIQGMPVPGVPYGHGLHTHLCVHAGPGYRGASSPSPCLLPPLAPWPLLWRARSYPRAFCIGIQALASLFPAC